MENKVYKPISNFLSIIIIYPLTILTKTILSKIIIKNFIELKIVTIIQFLLFLSKKQFKIVQNIKAVKFY